MAPLLTPLANWVRRQPALRAMAHGAVRLMPDLHWTVRVESLGPIRIRLRRHRWFLWEPFGRYDGPILGAFDRLVRDGDVAWDIGGNIGVYTRVLKHWFNASQVIAVEPMAENFELLEENIRLGGSTGMQALRMALSDRNGEEALQIDDVTSGTAVLDSISGGEASQGRKAAGLPPRAERVAVRRLDDLVENEGFPAPQFMKIDTEGAEVKVLRGAERTLRTHRPRLSIALHGPDKARDTIALLESIGYVCAGEACLADGSRLWRRLRPEDGERIGNNNIVAAVEDDLVLAPIARRAAGPRTPRTVIERAAVRS